MWVTRAENPGVRERLRHAFTYGNYWSGEAEQVTTSLTYKLPPRFTISVSTNQTFARLPEGHVIARIFTSNISFAVSPSLSLSNLVQYDNRSRNLGWQRRVRWTLEPGNDLFFAFNQGWIQEDGGGTLRFRTQDSKASAKFQVLVSLLNGHGAAGLGVSPWNAPLLLGRGLSDDAQVGWRVGLRGRRGVLVGAGVRRARRA